MGEILVSSKTMDDSVVTECSKFKLNCQVLDFENFEAQIGDEIMNGGVSFDQCNVLYTRRSKQINHLFIYLNDGRIFGLQFPIITKLVFGEEEDGNVNGGGFVVPAALRNIFSRNNFRLIGYHIKTLKEELKLMGIDISCELIDIEDLLPKGKSAESLVIGKKLKFLDMDNKVSHAVVKAYLSLKCYLKIRGN